MLKPQVRRLSRQLGSAAQDVSPVTPGVTAYVVDMPEILAGDHPLFGAIADLDATVNEFAADTHVLVVVQKATGSAGLTR